MNYSHSLRGGFRPNEVFLLEPGKLGPGRLQINPFSMAVASVAAAGFSNDLGILNPGPNGG